MDDTIVYLAQTASEGVCVVAALPKEKSSSQSPEPEGTGMDLRAAPVGSWAIAVCVCVDCLIYLYITAHHCTLIPVHTSAQGS